MKRASPAGSGPGAALLKSQRLFQLQIERMPVAHIVWGTDFRVQSWNPAAEKIFGYTAQEALRKHPYELIVPRRAQRQVTEVWERLLQGDATAQSLNANRTKAGETIMCEWSNTPLKETDGTVVGVLSMAQDVTERTRMETMRQQRLTELERAILRISEREQRRLGQDLHDDLCQQLAGIEYLGQALASRLAGAAGQEASAEQAREISRMVQRAMKHTHELAQGLSPVRLEAEGLMEAFRELAGYAQRVYGVAGTFTCARPVLVPDHGQATHLYRIGQEAVGNAIKHGKASRVRIRLAKTAAGLVLEIEDNGVGMPARPGTVKGMGLRIMQYRAEVMGGRVTVRRQCGGGTRVSCRVPSVGPSGLGGER